MRLSKEEEKELERKYKELLKNRKHDEFDVDYRDIGGFLMLVGGFVILISLNAGIVIGGAILGVGYYLAYKA